MKANEIRETFLKFFEKQGHQRVKSSSLIPAADPTLLFTNAGMNQFKDSFLGLQDPGYRRATTCQKCVRAGGKHNDLENVGFTARHQTFFEMLGNFSFGDYFKKEAIAFAWELVTQQLKIPEDRLRVTVFEQDDEAFNLWKAQGVPTDRIIRLGEADNFWAMGDTGPCGPCSEIYYDWGVEHGFGPGDTQPGGESTRFVEFWNLVFMQFNRDSSGKRVPLPKPSVDTGAGLERITAILQGVYSNYDTDLFLPLLEAIGKRTGHPYRGADETLATSMRVVADHLRSGTFLLSDGVVPSNEGRGYVLRRILRRAIRHGKKLGQDRPFMFELVKNVVDSFAGAYPELKTTQGLVETMMEEEETRFHETLHRGMGLLEEKIQELAKQKKKILPGEIAFKLYDTFGFPLDLIQVIAKEHDLEVDEKTFASSMEKQRSQSSWKTGGDASLMENLNKALEAKRWETTFQGYDETFSDRAKLLMVFSHEGKEVKELASGHEGFAVFEKTPFYAESGGQIGDKGQITAGTLSATVAATFKIGKTFLHPVKVAEGKLVPSELYTLTVDPAARKLTAINHSATHLLHAALRSVLGERVKQAGSLVDPTRLRFDFTFPRPMTPEELSEVENRINDQIAQDGEVVVKEMPFDDAMKSGALAFFDEKYGDRVRVVRMGTAETNFSVELCGGTHLSRTSEIGWIKVLSESSVASGVRRIEAITSVTALNFLKDRSERLAQVESRLGVAGEAVLTKLQQLVSAQKTLQRENEDLKLKVAQSGAKGGGTGALWEKKIQVGELSIIREMVPAVNPKILRTLVDQIRDKLKEKTIVMLASHAEGKVFMCVGLTSDLVGRWDASKIIQPLAQEVGGTGGGRNDFAQAGGTDPNALPRAFEKFEAWVKANKE
jgi:alanyl-tRNA synthetase